MAKRRIRYRPEAVEELQEAERWYRARHDQAADRWLEAAGQTIEAIAESPEMWAQDRQGIREVRVHHFPYAVAYRVHADFVEIVAIAHTKRRRGYWRNRLRQN
jgi:toxin ParE1/3/4